MARAAARPSAGLRRTALAVGVLALLAAPRGPRPAGVAAAGEVPKALADKIDAAVDRGSAWLQTRWTAEGTFPPVEIRGTAQYTVGTTCLCALALLAAGVPKADPRFAACVSTLRRLDASQAGGTRNTYDTGLLLVLLVELHGQPPKTVKGTSARGNPCGLPEDVRAWVQELASSLEASQLETGGWRYPLHPPADVSNTQYALLGLRAARDCGAVVRATTFQRALEWALGLQAPDGPKVRRTEPASPGQREYAVDAGDRARGWPYQNAGEPASGSTTTSGLVALVVGNDALLRPRFPGYAEDVERRVRRAVQDGFAWLDANFTVAGNPPFGKPWHLSYLYGLERACILAGRDHVGKHDWYRLGAETLVGMQREDGRWSTGTAGPDVTSGDDVETAFALLFLKRAVRPATPVPAPVVTTGD
jgi:hypothetical protein